MDVDRFKFPSPVDSEKWKEQCSWVLGKYGPIGERWDYQRSNFYFTTERDRFLFQIEWG